MSHKKRILHVRHSLGEGGITTLVDAMVDLNEGASVQHDVLVWKDAPKRKESPSLIDMSGSSNRKHDFAKMIEAYDLIFVHSLMPFMLGALLKKKPNVYLFQHGITFGSGAKRLFKRLYYAMIINFFRFKVICSSEFAKRKLLSKVPVFDKSLLLIIRFGINIQVPKLQNISKGSTLNIGFAGRLVGQKRVSKIIDALQSVKDDVTILFHIAGDGPLLEPLQSKAKAFDTSKVSFKFYGFLENMEDFYSKLDVFILPSIGESFGLVVLEAICRNIPTIVFNDSGACVEFIQEGSSGYIVNSPEELSEKLRELSDVSLRSELHQKMTQMNLNDYDISKTRAKLDAL